jgi:hypothetical protein
LVDALTITIVAALVQTIVITLTLVVFIFQFRSQEKAIREASYQNLMGRYNDFIMMQASKPEFLGVLARRVGSVTNREPSPEEAAVYGNLLVAYGIIEEAHGLYKKKWIDEETWGQWAAWLKSLSNAPGFAQLHEVTKGTFDPEFQKLVDKIIAEKSA